MEFARVAKGDGVQVYQAVRRLVGKPAPCSAHRDVGRDEDCADCAAGERPVAVLPEVPEVVSERLVAQVLKSFSGRVLHAISISVDSGILVRVEPRACPSCGAGLEDAHRFCPSCGTALEED